MALEQDSDGYLWLVGAGPFEESRVSIKMPACLADAEKFFADLKRKFDPTKLPRPYQSFWPGLVQ